MVEMYTDRLEVSNPGLPPIKVERFIDEFRSRNERLAEARQLIEKALALAPDDGFILDSMGWVLYRQGDLAGALTYLERSYAKREDPEVAAHLGEVLWALGRQDDASRVLQAAQKAHPTNEALAETVRKLIP